MGSNNTKYTCAAIYSRFNQNSTGLQDGSSFFYLVFTQCKGEQPLQGMGLATYKEKKHKKIKTYRKSVYKTEAADKRCLLILEFKPFRS